MNKALFVHIFSICIFTSSFSEAQNTVMPERLDLTKIFTAVPKTSLSALKMSVSPESGPYWFLVLGSTGVSYYYDEDILREGQKLGRQWGISNKDNTKTVIEFGDLKILRLPTDISSTLYFLGDGWIHVGLAGSMLIGGYVNNNNRVFNTGVQLMHGFVTSTIFSQAFKRIAGRESPNQSTAYLGRWRPLPTVKTYNTHTADYDAMPSGHVMTATLTFTVLIENYPEYRNVLLPLEITWLTALGFGMVNNGVHWASDYPIGIAMGYLFGKAAAELGHEDKTNSKNANQPHGRFVPGFSQQGTMTANYLYQF